MRVLIVRLSNDCTKDEILYECALNNIDNSDFEKHLENYDLSVGNGVTVFFQPNSTSFLRKNACFNSVDQAMDYIQKVVDEYENKVE